MVEAGRARPLGKGAVNASAAHALVLLFDAGSCGRRLEQSSDERAKGRRGEGLGAWSGDDRVGAGAPVA